MPLFDEPGSRESFNAGIRDVMAAFGGRPGGNLERLTNTRNTMTELEMGRQAKLQAIQEKREYEESRLMEARAYQEQQRQANNTLMAPFLSPEEQVFARAGYGDLIAKQHLANPKSTSAMQNAIAMGFDPGTEAYNEAIWAQIQPRSTNVNVSTGKGDTAWQQSKAKGLSARLDGIRGQMSNNAAVMEKYSTLRRIGTQMDENGGMVGSNLLWGIDQMRSVGIDAELFSNTTNMQEFRAISNSLIADEMNKAKGPQTDQDRQFLATTKPNLDTNPTARKNMISYQRSRMMIDNSYLDGLNELSTMPDLSGALGAYNTMDKDYRKTPSAVNVDGKTLTFEQYHQQLGGGDVGESLQEWIRELKSRGLM